MRVLLRVIATLLLIVGIPMAWVATATAEAPTQAGWWFKLNATATPAPPAAPVPAPVPVEVSATRPPNVPEGGLLVANDPSGPAAIAAVQLSADEGATGTLTLTRASGGTGDPLIVACPTVGIWAPAEGGPWEERPDFDCSIGKIVGTATDESVTFALDSSVAAPGGGFDIVLVPDPDSGTPFQTPFEEPGDDAWAPVGGTSSSGDSASSGGDLGTDVTDTASDSGSDSGSGDASFDSGGGAVDTGSSGGGGGSDFSTDFSSGDAAIDAGTPAVDGAAPAAEAPGAPLTATGNEVAGGPARTIADENTSAERLTAIGLLVALAGGLFWVSSRQGAAAGEVAPAGVGRFARPRAGRPNGLT